MTLGAFPAPDSVLEYNARAAVPEHPQILARWAGQGAAARAALNPVLDLPYGDSPGQTLDFYPAGREGAPLLVFIHGGYWRSLDKSDFSWIAAPFVARGVAVAMPNYDLCPAVSIETIVRQMLRAFAWLYREAPRYRVDRQRIVASGHSAGGHLTAMMMAARWPEFAPDLPRDLVSAGLAVSGLYDLEPLVEAEFLRADLRLDRAQALRVSPAWMVPATAAPLVTAVGGAETGAFQRQTALIAERWPENFRYQTPAPGCNHFTVCDLLGNPTSAVFHAAMALLEGSGR